MNEVVAAQIVRELSRLAAPRGTFAILGNDDHWTDAQAVALALDRAGLTLLRNAGLPILRAGETLHIVGIDDVWEQHDDIPGVVRDVPVESRVILLAREPDFADKAAQDGRIGLQLSGHTHGGHVRLPGVGGIRFHYRGHTGGLHRIGDTFVYTNRGTGVITPPLRFDCPPEVTVLKLTAED